MAMLVRRIWLVAPITVVVCATFGAHAVAALVDAQVPEPAPLPRKAPPREKAKALAKPDGSTFVARNMFCSTCAPQAGPGPTESFVPDAQLIATSVGADPRATVRVRATEAQGSWGLDEEIPGVGKIDRIGFVTIDVVDGTGRHATLSLLEPAQATTAIAAPVPAPTDAYADRLKRIDDTTFEVDRSLVRELVGGSMAKAGARVSPMSKDGALIGLKVLGVRRDGLAGRLGLQNGDVLEGINNTKIESANTLLGLYAQLETLDTVELEGTRHGKPLTLTLRLR
jgi:hypothetical protein